MRISSGFWSMKLKYSLLKEKDIHTLIILCIKPFLSLIKLYPKPLIALITFFLPASLELMHPNNDAFNVT
jgi:hypothetical protein